MNVNVLEVMEQDDGSAVVELRLDKEALEFFVSEGLNTVLRKVIDSSKET
jgi:hypothetical protein